MLGHDPRTSGHEVRGRIGYSPEHHNLPPDLPATDFVQHIAEVHGMPRTDAVGRASDALWFVGMGEERIRPLGTLSTGQRQRVKLAMAIAHDPELVLLDEPTDGLDPTQRETMLDLIRRLSSDFGMNVPPELASARRGRAHVQRGRDPEGRPGHGVRRDR